MFNEWARITARRRILVRKLCVAAFSRHHHITSVLIPLAKPTLPTHCLFASLSFGTVCVYISKESLVFADYIVTRQEK